MIATLVTSSPQQLLGRLRVEQVKIMLAFDDVFLKILLMRSAIMKVIKRIEKIDSVIRNCIFL